MKLKVILSSVILFIFILFENRPYYTSKIGCKQHFLLTSIIKQKYNTDFIF